MRWWCSAQGVAWDWTWRPYVGVWVIVLLLVGAYFTALTRWAPQCTGSENDRTSRRDIALFLSGVLVFSIAADWPIGALGAGYLLSVHTLQYILLAFVVPPLVIMGCPRWLLRRLIEPRWAFLLAWILSRPLVAFAIFNVVMLATHLPTVVDRLTVSQWGSFAVDMSWLFSGLVFWWQVLGRLPELRPLSYPGRLVFLIANIFIPTVPAAFLTFADYPIYALYELAPRVAGISATADQQLAGLTMKIVGGFIIFGTASVLFFKWYSEEERAERAAP